MAAVNWYFFDRPPPRFRLGAFIAAGSGIGVPGFLSPLRYLHNAIFMPTAGAATAKLLCVKTVSYSY
jgi:hypothetical protein